MKNQISQFILNRRLAQIKRYHATPLHQNETVAEHSFYVAMIARSLCGLLEESGTKVNTLEVVDKALIHDIEEMFSGDIIQPFKHANPRLKKLIGELNTKFVEKAFEGLPKQMAAHFKNLWAEYHEGRELEDKIVKVADILSLIAYCLEQIKLGNTYMVEILNNGVRLIKNYKFSWLRPILVDVNSEIKNLKLKI